MYYTTEQLKELEKKLVSDLEAVRRVMARNADPDLIRVSSLLGETKPATVAQNLFESPIALAPKKDPVKNKEIAQVVMKFATQFKFADVVSAVKREFPDRQLKIFSAPAVLRNLRKKGKIKEVMARQGRNGAVYVKV